MIENRENVPVLRSQSQKFHVNLQVNPLSTPDHPAVEASVLDRFGEMGGLDRAAGV